MNKENQIKILIFLVFLFSTTLISGQSDGCSAATSLPVTANCSSPTAGTTAGATQTISGCVGNADDDVWYQFVATSTSHEIAVAGSASFDAVVQMFSGSCATLVSLNCQDVTFNGGTETIFATGLTIGNTYRVRVYHYGVGSGSNTFTICITVPAPAPSNDACASAISLSVNGACVNTAATSASATQSFVGCAGTADDDVWFSFVATNSVQTITVDPSSAMDPVLQLYSGTCGSLNSLYCEDSGFTNGNEVINAVGLIAGNTYFVRVYDYYTSTGGDAFDICIVGTPTAVPTNDEPCSAIALPAVTSACNNLSFTTTGATASVGAPTPSSCVGGSGAAIGGFSASSSDVWFSVVVPTSGSLYVTPQPNFGISDGVMVMYTGTCSSLTQVMCSDDNNYPGGANDLLPYVTSTSLTPGATVYIRYFGFGSSSGDFGLCVTSPTNDNCTNALYICDINGYSSSTSAAYTPDRPCNMHGNNETSAGVNLVDGTNSGGIFGAGGAWGSGAPFFDVNIENNSWIEFTAGATTAVLSVSVYDCWVGGYPSGGIQMQIFSGTNCCSFVPVSNFEENSTGFTITANGLTIGQNYYLMIDGYAGDICSYTINANSGVLFPNITTTANPICTGTPVTLTAPSGATGYTWYPGGQTTQSITESPSSTTTYTCIVDGVCGYKQTLTETITVNQLPNVTSASSGTICSGDNVNYNIVSDLASTYVWSAASNTNVTGESTSAQTTSTINDVLTNAGTSVQTVNYAITPTSSNGCVGPTVPYPVTVNPSPTLSAIGVTTICSGSTLSIPLSSSVSSTHSWLAASNTNITGESTSAQTGNTINDNLVNTSSTPQTVNYTVTPTSTAGSCIGSGQTVSVTVNPTPNANAGANINMDCNNPTDAFVATGGGTYSWSTPAGSLSGATVNVTSASGTGNYTVTVTSLGCTDTDLAVLAVDFAQPVANVGTAPMIDCTNPSVIINGSSSTNSSGGSTGITYAWVATAGGNISGSSTVASPTVSSAGTYTLTVTQTNGCTDTESVAVTANASVPVANIAAAGDLNCSVTSLTLDGSGSSGTGITYLWTTTGTGNIVSGATTDSPVINAPGAYTLTVEASNGCTNSNVINITEDITQPTVTIASASDIDCNNASITIDGSGSSQGANFAYSWTTTTGNIVSSGTTDSPIVDLNGTYVLEITNNTNNCVNTDQIVVAIDTTSPNADAGNNQTLTCAATSVALDGTGSSGTGIIYSWSGPNVVSGGTTSAPNVDLAGTYTLLVTGSNGCVATSNVDVIPDANAPAADAGIDMSITCSSSSVNLDGSGSDSGPTITYNWSTPDGNIVSGNGTNGIVADQGGTYLLLVTNTANGCTNSATVNVTTDTITPVAISNSSMVINCFDLTPELDASSSTGNSITYSWTTIGGNIIGATNIANPEIDAAGTYTLTVTAANGCIDTEIVNVLADTAAPIADFGATPTSGAFPLLVDFLDNSSGTTLTYNWSFGDGNTDTIQNPSNTYLNHGDFNPVLVVTEYNGCTDTASILIAVDGELIVVIPNVFTPNFDDNNDIFGVDVSNAKTVKAVIYNRWGQLLYEWDGTDGGWDGRTTAGLESAEGTYFYLFEITDLNDEVHIYEGHLVLRR